MNISSHHSRKSIELTWATKLVVNICLFAVLENRKWENSVSSSLVISLLDMSSSRVASTQTQRMMIIIESARSDRLHWNKKPVKINYGMHGIMMPADYGNESNFRRRSMQEKKTSSIFIRFVLAQASIWMELFSGFKSRRRIPIQVQRFCTNNWVSLLAQRDGDITFINNFMEMAQSVVVECNGMNK